MRVILLVFIVGFIVKSLGDTVLDENGPETVENQAPTNLPTKRSSGGKNEGISVVDEAAEAARRARRAKIQVDRRRDGAAASRMLLRQAASDGCDWRQHPIEFVKGRVCGAHYKVLGLDRFSGEIEKQHIKRAFRQRSLTVHPDKNPAPEADAAFKLAQAAYDCLSDDLCKDGYDTELDIQQENIHLRRLELKQRAVFHVARTTRRSYYYLSVAANYVYNLGVDAWNFAGDFEIDFLGTDRLPLGRVLLISVLALKGRFLLQMQAMAYVVMRVNYEVAKAQGVL